MGARLGQALLLAAMAGAQDPGPITRGTLLEWETGVSGQLSVRTAANAVYRFTFDSKTYFERENARTTAARLRQGDRLEVVSDRLSGSLLRYARTVHVIDEEPRRPPPPPGRYRAYRSSLDQILPMGNLTFAGLVCRLDGGHLVLRTRDQGEKTILLRQDTRYLENGVQVPASDLTLNLRVFIRGTRNFEDEVEAYQVIWGRILEPESWR